MHPLYFSTESNVPTGTTDLKEVACLAHAKRKEYKQLMKDYKQFVKESKLVNEQLHSEIRQHQREMSRSSHLLEHIVQYVLFFSVFTC